VILRKTSSRRGCAGQFQPANFLFTKELERLCAHFMARLLLGAGFHCAPQNHLRSISPSAVQHMQDAHTRGASWRMESSRT
jgi:hypothetical protein